MWWTITGNFGNILPIDWSKSYARKLHMPALNLNEAKVSFFYSSYPCLAALFTQIIPFWRFDYYDLTWLSSTFSKLGLLSLQSILICATVWRWSHLFVGDVELFLFYDWCWVTTPTQFFNELLLAIIALMKCGGNGQNGCCYVISL